MERGPIGEDIRVLIASDYDYRRRKLRGALQGSGVRFSAESTSGIAAIAGVKAHRPDVVLLDTGMRHLASLATLDAIGEAYPQVKVLMISTAHHPGFTAHAQAAGASGILHPEFDTVALRKGLMSALQGEFLALEP